MSDADTLARLRRRAARTEILGTLYHIRDAASELASVAPENMLNDIADFQDRLCLKIEALGGTAVPKRPSVSADRETFSVAGDDLLLQRLCAVHGEARADIAPELAARTVSP